MQPELNHLALALQGKEVAAITLSLNCTNAYDADNLWRQREQLLQAITFPANAQLQSIQLSLWVGKREYASTLITPHHLMGDD